MSEVPEQDEQDEQDEPELAFSEWAAPTTTEKVSSWIRRTLKSAPELPFDLYYSIKWFIQRGRRGWADRDTWGLDTYLAGWLPAALRHLKDAKAGTPMSMFDGLEQDENCNPTPEAQKIGQARWSDVMDRMIAGFEAWQRIEDGLYEKELGEYPLYRPKGTPSAEFRELNRRRMEASDVLRKRDEEIFKDGMALFTEHFGSLWD